MMSIYDVMTIRADGRPTYNSQPNTTSRDSPLASCRSKADQNGSGCPSSSGQQRDATQVLNDNSYLKETAGPRRYVPQRQIIIIRLNQRKLRRETSGVIADADGRQMITEESSAIKSTMALNNGHKHRLSIFKRKPMKAKQNNDEIRAKTMRMCHLSTARCWTIAPAALLIFWAILLGLLIASGQVGATRVQVDESPLEASLLKAAESDFSPMRRQPEATGSTAQRLSPRIGDHGQTVAEPKRTAGSSPKFSRMNELDLFLDDMNHNELRAVATGKPIGDYILQARPLTGGQTIQRDQHERLRQSELIINSTTAGKSTGPSSLDESQSEQQIYSECALILQRTYVKNIDNPKDQLVPFGNTEQACISYKHIDKAVEQAKHMLKFKELTKRRKKQKPKPPSLDIIHKTLEPPQDLIAAIGELNMATTQILANQFDLSNDELLNGLPLIDMSKTKFWPLCPALVKQDIKCDLSRYRTLTGHCNNLKHPTWGAAMTPFARYLPPVHPDGIWIPRKSVVTETVFDMSPASSRIMSQAGHQEPEQSQPRPILGDPHLPLMPPPPPPPPSHPLHQNELASMVKPDHLSPSASVQFASHVRPEEAELASMLQVQGSPQPPGIIRELDHRERAQAGLVVPSIYKRMSSASASTTRVATTNLIPSHINHYQESHSPTSPFTASLFPIRADASHPKVRHLSLLSSDTHQLAHKGHQARSVALDLPSARLVSSIVHRDFDLAHHDFSILFMSWGQLLDHDMTRAAQSPPSIKCCTDSGKPKHKLCLPIQVPHDDPFYSKHNVRCLEFRRTLAGLRPNCVLGPRVHQNAITSPIDANFIYGSSQAQSDSLRLFKGGRLRDRDWFKNEGLKPLLPAQDIDPDLECIARPKDLFCFLAGDVRVNEQTHLTVLHTIYMREHNRIADQLADLNPHWDDERLFQETRHIMAAGVQHVMINEYIPLLIGKKMADLYNLTAVSVVSEHHGMDKVAGLHWHGYDPSVTTSVSNSFAAAAFRQGHTFVQSSFERFNKFHEFVSSERLRHLFKRPFLLYQPGVMDELVAGMINQASQSYDPFISEDISGHLFQPPELPFGHDLAAINLQRGREQGLPGYNLFREWCGLPRAETFDQLEPYLTNHTAFHYSRLYRHVDDIDLWSGGVSERKLPGAAIGPTFACIIARQFSNTRRGDRFWYENPGLPSSFSPRQLMEIRKITLAKILCANSDDLPTFQRWALRLAHPVLNPRLPCDQLPQMDLRAWQEQ